MIAIDWTMMGLGALLGTMAGTLFFTGLALGMQIALRRARPMPILMFSAAIRIAALLALGWWVTGQGAVALAGFALAFLAVRFGVLTFAKLPVSKEIVPWN
jgi:hypothetical protein